MMVLIMTLITNPLLEVSKVSKWTQNSDQKTKTECDCNEIAYFTLSIANTDYYESFSEVQKSQK